VVFEKIAVKVREAMGSSAQIHTHTQVTHRHQWKHTQHNPEKAESFWVEYLE